MRLLWWGIVLASLMVLTGIAAVVMWARRRARLARLQTDFVANVTHELKTPLTGIRSLAETLALGRITASDRQAEFVSAIVRETDRLAQLINNVLDFSSIERGNARLRPERADLTELLQTAVEAFRATLPEGDDSRITVAAPDEPVEAVVDSDSISRAVTNLLDNAWKYSHAPRRIAATLSTEDGQASIAVSDNGVGIAPENAGKVFRKFFRIDSALSAETQGAGLGLALVKAYAEAHGGRVAVRSRPGEGSTFTITVPTDGGARDE